MFLWWEVSGGNRVRGFRYTFSPRAPRLSAVFMGIVPTQLLRLRVPEVPARVVEVEISLPHGVLFLSISLTLIYICSKSDVSFATLAVSCWKIVVC